MNHSQSSRLFQPSQIFKRIKLNPNLVFGGIISVALLFFEMFNYSTTEFALRDLLGSLKFAGLHWATILAIAFCTIDFAGIARLFTPEQDSAEPKEIWYLFGAWMLAATMNAMLTWWGVSMAIANHQLQSTEIVASSTIRTVIPIFVAIMVWLIRIMIIGTFSVAGDRLFWKSSHKSRASQTDYRPSMNPINRTANFPISQQTARPNPSVQRPSYARPRPEPIAASPVEATYHSVSTGATSSFRTPAGENSTNHYKRL